MVRHLSIFFRHLPVDKPLALAVKFNGKKFIDTHRETSMKVIVDLEKQAHDTNHEKVEFCERL